MKRKLLWLFIAGIAVGIVLSGLYRHFVTDQIMDGGNMENPDSTTAKTPTDRAFPEN